MYVISRGERFIPMGALTDPGAISTSDKFAPRPPHKRRAYDGDLVASRIKNKRDRLSKTSQLRKPIEKKTLYSYCKRDMFF